MKIIYKKEQKANIFKLQPQLFLSPHDSPIPIKHDTILPLPLKKPTPSRFRIRSRVGVKFQPAQDKLNSYHRGPELP